ncbi:MULTISPECIES: carbon-nitrogen hydrolase [unclassified Thioalkalivibrio]|uniref:carbon-nitrogen hydrolase n=1 Tax=unclassified Thioalkalivibrio TaxID=2621013 RepID=UPI00037717C0|nr:MULTISPECIES: carbon-nitrogen hydrolase [unclassified Thioalkalivibrio]
MSRDTLSVALIQHQDAGSVEANLDATAAAVATAAANGARLVVLAELHTGPYFCQTEDLATFDAAEPIPGPSSERLAAVAREHGVVLVGSLFERRAPGLYHNTAVVFETDGRQVGTYRKMHIPDDPGYYEKYYFTPGDTGFVPIDTSVGRLGVLVCWDQWYPEAARIMALSGAELLIYPTAIGWDPQDTPEEQRRQQEAWITVQRGHAVANNLPVIACNRTGHEPDPSGHSPGATFWGTSFVAGPQGEFLARAGEDAPEILAVELDRIRTEAVRRQWPFLRDRRIDAYAPILKRYIDPD